MERDQYSYQRFNRLTFQIITKLWLALHLVTFLSENDENIIEIILCSRYFILKAFSGQTVSLIGFKPFKQAHTVTSSLKSNRTWPQWAWIAGERRGRQTGALQLSGSTQSGMGHPASNCLFILCQRDLHIPMSPPAAREVQRRKKEGRLRGNNEKELGFHKEMYGCTALVVEISPALSTFRALFLSCSHLGGFDDPLTPDCYSIMQLSGLSQPHVLPEVNSVIMSLALNSTRCSASWLNTCYSSFMVILYCLSTTAGLFWTKLKIHQVSAAFDLQ